jgi:hypothetical protein
MLIKSAISLSYCLVVSILSIGSYAEILSRTKCVLKDSLPLPLPVINSLQSTRIRNKNNKMSTLRMQR